MMGKLAKIAGITALLTLALSVVLSGMFPLLRLSGLLLLASLVLAIAALITGFAARQTPEQRAAAKTGMITGALALVLGLLYASYATVAPAV